MITRTKTLLATLATGAMALAAAAPATAQDFGNGHNRGLNNGGHARHAINACSRVVERSANRYGHGRANVTDIRDVRDTRWGYEVRGRVDVRDGGRGGNRNDRNDWRGWNDRGRDSGSFKCRFERGRVVALDIDGIRGL